MIDTIDQYLHHLLDITISITIQTIIHMITNHMMDIITNHRCRNQISSIDLHPTLDHIINKIHIGDNG
jgi:hypothetical protein